MRHPAVFATIIIFALLLIHPAIINSQDNGQPQEIHCKHFICGYPLGTPETNDLIIRDLYALSNNDDTKFADWVCYKLTPDLLNGPKRNRDWESDPWLDENETMEVSPDDYRGAYNQDRSGYDRGHQAPLASFKGTELYYQVNYYSNITPQRTNLNQGPWKRLEDKVRDLVVEYENVWVMTGPLYMRDMGPLPNCDEDHVIPSGYWKIIVIIEAEEILAAGFILDQDTEGDADFCDHLCAIDEIETASGLDFFRELNVDDQSALESALPVTWVDDWQNINH